MNTRHKPSDFEFTCDLKPMVELGCDTNDI